MIKNRDGFSSKLGVIAAAAGSAVGLGNIWKFPYVAGQNGGAAFILIYLLFTFLVALPVLLSAFVMGRSTGKNAVGAFKSVSPRGAWKYVGLFGILAALLLISFYGVVAGWTTEYVYLALTNQLNLGTAEAYQHLFESRVANPESSIFWLAIFLAFTVLIVISGVKNGIEKYAKLLMPLLFALLLVLAFRSITLDGADKGIDFLLNPDFSKLSAEAVLSALGQAFFSLSVGIGTMVIYGSYIRKDVNLQVTASEIALADVAIAILSGLAIFPAVFAYNVSPSAGPGLVFITLPQVFQYMPAGYFFSLSFFVLLFVAALTSSISMLEVLVSFFVEEYDMRRKRVAISISLVIIVLGSICALSNNLLADVKLFGLSIFDLFDYIVTNLAMPIGSFTILVFVGWRMDQNIVKEELGLGKRINQMGYNAIMFLVKFVAPSAVLIIFLNGIGLLG
ncbi:sodium-dependent transporter [Aureibacter tunicatorum]|uniref:Transporter n=1 Tax=Aureibacter tunicatorum TaxID=866807 RepID=A0AAE3XQR7_9BACT|nr:sodium-dependent transporter [Aureibacter tunicatorum]MDR6240196.1 NSS family neurotransmitter:Na+ symporter [Aureibacter tunicatorum]BDD05923.1 transporter [Aureibacter tunicatorum]